MAGCSSKCGHSDANHNTNAPRDKNNKNIPHIVLSPLVLCDFAKLNMTIPRVMAVTWLYSRRLYVLLPTNTLNAITGTILHDLPRICVGYDTYWIAWLLHAMAARYIKEKNAIHIWPLIGVESFTGTCSATCEKSFDLFCFWKNFIPSNPTAALTAHCISSTNNVLVKRAVTPFPSTGKGRYLCNGNHGGGK